jgi:hypothetical protein
MTMNTVLADAIARLTAELPEGTGAVDVSLWGRELSCVLDCTDGFATITDPRLLLLQALARRCDTPRGALPAHDDDDYGLDLRGMLHAGLTQSELASMQGRIAGEFKKDRRVETVTVRATFAASRLTVTGGIMPRDPALEPFPFVMDVTQAAITIAVSG